MTDAITRGYLALPDTGSGPAVLVLHAWWGLNDTIRAFCLRLAEAGFVAFAPDLYHGQVTDTIPGAESLAQALDGRHLDAKAEIRAALAFLAGRSGGAGVGVVGFSLGAYFALDASNAAPEYVRAVAAFYGTGAFEYDRARAAYLCHFAENDPYEPAENVAALTQVLQQAGRPAMIHTYPGTGHWFFEPDRVDAYNAEAATQAWDRTLDFLKRELTSGS